MSAPVPSRRSLSFTQERLCLALLLLTGIVLRLLVQRQSFWVDETASANIAQEPLAHLWSDWMHRETNPPLYYTALQLWSHVAGASDEAMRLLSILEGCVATMFAALIARRAAGIWAGLMVAALMAVAPAQVYYSVEVRGYVQAEMGALLAMLGAMIFCEAGQARGRWTGLGLYMLGCLIALYSHTMLALMPLLVNLWMVYWLAVVRKAPLHQWLAWSGANLLVLLAWSWWIGITLWQLRHAPNIGWIPTPSLAEGLWQLPHVYGAGEPFPLHPVLSAIVQTLGMGALIVALLAMIRVSGREPALMLAVCAVGAPVLLFLISQKTPVMVPRVFLWTLGPMLVCVAIGLMAIRTGWIRYGLLGILLLSNLAGTMELTRRGLGEPFKQIVAGIVRVNPQATVIGNSMDSALSLRRYCPPQRCGLSISALRVGQESWSADMPMPRITRRDLPDILRRKGEIYMVFRSLGKEAVPELAPIGTGVNISRHFGPANYVVVERWRLKR